MRKMVMQSRTASRLWCFVFWAAVVSILSGAQEPPSGRELYAKASPSVLLIKVLSSSGEEIALGSGFLISKDQIVTNAHVADAGSLIVEVGPVKIPAIVERKDVRSDLALLKIGVQLTVIPLGLANADPNPGETIYAIGNPEGLEKSISQGLVSAQRTLEGQRLLQVTAAISHGSSGGPVLNASGQVVGVAVAMLKSGQNLNFAVPVSVLKSFLSSTSETPKKNVQNLLATAAEIGVAQQADTYSEDESSPYQRKEAEQVDILLDAYHASAGNVADLLATANKAKELGINAVALKAAEDAHKLRSDPDTKILLSSLLSQSVFWEEDLSVRKPALARAEKLAREAVEGTKRPTYRMYFQLANVLENEQLAADSTKYYRLALATAAEKKDKAAALRGLLRQIGNSAEGDSLFAALQQVASLTAFDWRDRGESLSDRGRYSEAAVAYLAAANATFGTYADWCEGGRNSYLAASYDGALEAERKCIQLGSTFKGSEQRIEVAHRLISAILNERGVFSEALSHAQDAVSIDPNDTFAYDDMADALIGLHRYQEAINAAKQAIRLSDGKFAFMHFKLGSAYFEAENWEFARQSFEKAAELNLRDDAAAYNVALCYARQGFYRDAAHWYEEVLRRNPNHRDKADIQQRIRELRQ